MECVSARKRTRYAVAAVRPAGVAVMRALLSILSLLAVSVSAARSTDDAYLALIRAERFGDAYALGQRELADFDAKHPAAGFERCEILDRIARVQLFDYNAPDLAQQKKILGDARDCHGALPEDAHRNAQITWLTLRLDTLSASHGKLAEMKEEAARAATAFQRDRAVLRPIDLVGSYHALGGIALNGGDYATALARYSDGVAAAGSRDPYARAARAVVQVMLGPMLERNGHFAEAIEASRLALRWNSEVFGTHSLTTASVLGTLAQTEFFSGRYADALEHAETGIREARPYGEPGKRALAFMLMTYGNSLRVTGELPRARAALTEALAVEREASASSVGTLASRLNQLGYVDELIDGCAVALPRYREALALGEKQFGVDSVRIAVALTNMGGCELKLAHYSEAESLFERALAITKKGYGDRHPAVAKVLFDLAEIALARHAYADAEKQMRVAFTLLPADPSALATTGIGAHRALAQALHGLGRDDEAFAEAVVAETARQRVLRAIGANLSEANALAFKENLAGALDLALALAVHDPQPARVASAWQLQIGARQLVTGLVAARLKVVRQRADAPGEQAWRAWEEASRRYGDALLGHEGGKVDANGLAESSTALDRAERLLAHQLGDSALPLATAPPDLAALKQSLPEGSALVAYAIANADPWDDLSTQAGQHVYAFALAQDGGARLLDLGATPAIDTAIRAWVSGLRDPRSEQRDVSALGEEVRQRIWDPLALPDAIHRVFVVPEGDVHRVAWLALPTATENWAEAGMATQLLGSERELVAVRRDTPDRERLLLVGPPAPGPASLQGDPACPQALRELGGAASELAELRGLWRSFDANAPISLLDGNHATRQAVRTEAERGTVLHFATHAFSGDSACVTHLLATRGVRLSSSRVAQDEPRRTASNLSGLVLAAAPVRGSTDAGDSGILTASEVAAFKLDQVENVTLAACDTGLGPVHPDEGVFGLARAFRVAGARNVVMSLWQVDDAATADLMRNFYRQRLGERSDTSTALALAARQTLAARRAAGLSTHPYYWAAFVATGDALPSDGHSRASKTHTPSRDRSHPR